MLNRETLIIALRPKGYAYGACVLHQLLAETLTVQGMPSFQSAPHSSPEWQRAEQRPQFHIAQGQGRG